MNNRSNKVIKDLLIIIGAVIISPLIYILFIVGKEDVVNKKITKEAINYFSGKYNINKKDIKIVENNLYGEDKTCIDSCGENELIINYNNKEYTIEYETTADFFIDDYQYDKIEADLTTYLKNKFNFINKIDIDMIDLISDKYDGNIEEYYQKVKEFYNNNKYTYYEGQLVADDITTYIDIWIEANDKTSAKELKEKYSDELINELEKIGVNYDIDISTESDANNYSVFYNFDVSNSVTPSFIFVDNVDNNTIHCNREEIKQRKCY